MGLHYAVIYSEMQNKYFWFCLLLSERTQHLFHCNVVVRLICAPHRIEESDNQKYVLLSLCLRDIEKYTCPMDLGN